MLKVTERTQQQQQPDYTLTLPFEQRKKSRLRITLDGLKEEVAIILDRGKVLRGGDCLKAETGEVIKILAAQENVSTVYTSDLCLMSRVSYHLGNRHVPLQVSDGWVRYLDDHVLDNMVKEIGLGEIGLRVEKESAPFEPEAGAYGTSGHTHHSDHKHS